MGDGGRGATAPPYSAPALGSMRGTLTSRLTFPEDPQDTQTLSYAAQLFLCHGPGRVPGSWHKADPLLPAQVCAQGHVQCGKAAAPTQISPASTLC